MKTETKQKTSETIDWAREFPHERPTVTVTKHFDGKNEFTIIRVKTIPKLRK
ncbi:MAG: hypothetical protein ABSE71_03215 [Candidatus Micrarchaeaceae archaeon]|jgi:hypothetical protein